MGFRFDRENGFYGRRRWSFDIDDLLMSLLWLALVALAVVGVIYVSRSGHSR